MHIIDKISLNVPQLEQKLISDAEIIELDKNQSIQGTLLIRQSDAMNLQNRFDAFAREMTEPFANDTKSIHYFCEIFHNNLGAVGTQSPKLNKV